MPLIILLLILFPLIPFGDLLLSYVISKKLGAGFFSIILPILTIAALIFYSIGTGINLFKLFLPRLFLGILLGWSTFWGAANLWKSSLTMHIIEIIVADIILLVIIFIYIFTDIKNKVVKVSGGTIIKRTMVLLFFAMIISLIQGFYVIQFQAKPILENSDAVKNIDKVLSDSGAKRQGSSDKYTGRLNFFIFKCDNFQSMKLYWFNYRQIYIWSVLFFQFIISILIGVVLQSLWEDRPITEPL